MKGVPTVLAVVGVVGVDMAHFSTSGVLGGGGRSRVEGGLGR